MNTQRPKIAYIHEPVEQGTCKAIRELGYHVVVLERDAVITPQLILMLEEKVRAFELEQGISKLSPLLIPTSEELP